MRNILITGITGTLGTEVTRQLNEEIEEFNIFGICRAEKNIVNFPHDAAISICDIRDKQRLERYIEIIEPDIIFHFAALKHVNMGEVFCEEFVKTNCNGTSNLCEIIAMPKNNHIRLVLSSTDKAVNPINVYGCTKYIAETMIKRLPSYVICRYGNVFGSNGSIIDRMKKGVIDGTGKELKLTDKEMTRFFISIENAAKFVIDMGLCLSMTGLHIPKMKSARMAALFGIYFNEYFTGEAVKFDTPRPGEKIHEKLSDTLDSLTAEKFTREELREMLKKYIG